MPDRHVPDKAKRKPQTAIPSGAFDLLHAPRSSEDKHPVFVFRDVDHGRWPIHEWQGRELTDLVDCFIKVERMTWSQVKTSDGLGYKIVENPPRCAKLPPDNTLHEMKVDQRKRIMGYRAEEEFCLIWFDREHDVCPQGKVRREK